MDGSRWMAAGHATGADAEAAGADAAATALGGRADAALLVVFGSDEMDLPALLRGIRRVTGPVPLIGCSTAGEITGSGPSDHGAVVLALGGPGFSVATAVAGADGPDGLRGAGTHVAGCVEKVADRPHRALLLLSDGLAGDQEELVRGAYGVVGDDSSVLRATDEACASAVGALGGRNPLGLLAFDCIARRGVLGEHGLPIEVERIAAHAAGGPVAGFYTYGEIARTTGTGGFHNQTLVVMAVA